MIGILGALDSIQGQPRPDDTSVVPPIDRMAALPQTMIMTMAQKGQIPKDMVMAILGKKAENAQNAAALRAVEQQMTPPPPTTVLEQLMQRNAQADVGIPTVAGNNMANPALMRSGGIVAFANGGMPFSPVADPNMRAMLAMQQQPEYDEEAELKKQIQMRMDAREEFLGDAPKMDTSPEITSRDLALAGLQAAFSMGQGPNFLSNVLEGGKAGVTSLTKTPQDRAAAEFKAKQTEYLAKSGAIDEALKTVGKRADTRQEQDYKAGQSEEDRNLKTTLSANEIRSNELIASNKLKNALKISKGQNFTSENIANIKANTSPELVKIANVLGMGALKPDDPDYAKKSADFLGQAADLTGKFTAANAAKIGLIEEAVKGANKIMEQQFNIGGLGRHLLMASAAYDTLTEKQKTDIDNAIDKYNVKPENKDNKISAKGEQGAREMFDRVYLKGFNALQKNTLDSLSLTPAIIKELMAPSGTYEPGTNNDSAGTTVESERDFNDLKKEPEK